MCADPNYPNVVVMDHPLIQHKLSILRDVGTGAKEFRELVKELAMLMAYEATRDFQLVETTVTTPIQETKTYVLSGKKVAVIPILRAGLGMVEGILELIPAAKVGHVIVRVTSASALTSGASETPRPSSSMRSSTAKLRPGSTTVISALWSALAFTSRAQARPSPLTI